METFNKLTLKMTLETSEAAKRLSTRTHADVWDRKPLEFSKRLRDGYRAIAEYEPWRVVVLDGSQDEYVLLSQAQDAIFSRVMTTLPKHGALAKRMGIMDGVGTFEE